MRVNAITLSGFRNYEDFSAQFSPEMNIICGENAQGKTNLIESIAFLSGAKSHRTRSDKELVRFGQDTGAIHADILSRGREFHMDIALSKRGRRSLLVNDVKIRRAGELSSFLRTVLFCPEDLSLVRSGAQERRRFLDASISQLRPKYAEALQQYNRLLEHKTRILRDWPDNPALLDVLEEFNDGMARTGALVLHYRAHFLRRLSKSAAEIQTDFSGGREHLEIRYETVKTVTDPYVAPAKLYPQLLEHQQSHRQAELSSRLCLSGPHKDDFLCSINGKSARQFASQGQTRTLALALKLAERTLHQEDTGQWPVLLLDDVLSELDAKRQDFVLERIAGGQVFLTGCDVPPFARSDSRILYIQQGALCEISARDAEERDALLPVHVPKEATFHSGPPIVENNGAEEG